VLIAYATGLGQTNPPQTTGQPAAAASTLTELALFIGGWWLLTRQGLQLPVVSGIAPILLSALLMGIVVYLIRGWPLGLVIVIGAAVYGVAVYASRTLTSEELSIIRSGLTGR